MNTTLNAADTKVSPAVWFARILGLVLTVVGLVGFTMTTSVDSTSSLLGFDINLSENIIHLATGLVGLVAGLAILTWARSFALILGVVYLATGIWGLFDSNPLSIFGNLNSADNALHIGIGVVGLIVFAVSRSTVISSGTFTTPR